MKFVSENPYQGKIAEISKFYSLCHWLYSTKSLNSLDESGHDGRFMAPRYHATGERDLLQDGDLIFILPERVEIMGYAVAGEPACFCRVLHNTKIGWLYEKAIDYKSLKVGNKNE